LCPLQPQNQKTPEIYTSIQNITRYEFPSFQTINSDTLRETLRVFDMRLKDLYMKNVQFWDHKNPLTFGQFILSMKFYSLDMPSH
jgi:hypothetical protein